jgi:signal transduction histidine kinase
MRVDKQRAWTYTWDVMEDHTQHEIDQLRRMVVQLSRLVEISVTLNSTLDLTRLLQFITHSAADLVDSRAASILMVDENTHDLYVAAATDVESEALSQVPVPRDGSIAGTIVRQDRPLILNDVGGGESGFREVGTPVRGEVRTLIGVPLRIRDRVTGVLEAVNKHEGIFDETDLQILTNVASLAAVAIQNARQIQALNRAYEELGKVEKLKSDFIAIASHELRTPLGLILGNAALLMDHADEQGSEYAEAVLSSAERMRALVEEMTNMNMLQMASAEVMMTLRPLSEVVQAAHDEVINLVHAKGQEMVLTLPELSIRAMVDSPKLTMAIAHLLNNAIRFTDSEGRIELTLETHGREAWIRVCDDGAGIPADQLDTVFDLFYQVEDHLTRRHGGLGLGLAIVKAIAEAHGGRIWVESEGVEKGAAFTLAVPLSA